MNGENKLNIVSKEDWVKMSQEAKDKIIADNRRLRKGVKNPKTILKSELNDTKKNRFKGWTPNEIYDANGNPGEWTHVTKGIYKDAYPLDRRMRNYGTTMNSIAIEKLTTKFNTEHVANLKPSEYAALVACDDPLSTMFSVGSTLYSLAQNPTIKTILTKLYNTGMSTVSSLFGSKSQVYAHGVDDIPKTIAHTGTDSVNLEHVFGCLTPALETVSDPIDIPKIVYTARCVTDYVLTPNAAGNAMFYVSGNQMSSGTATNRDAFIGFNNTTGYIPTSASISGTWSYIVGPISAQYGSLYLWSKMLGMQVTAKPTTSINNSEGMYIMGNFTDQMSTGVTGHSLTNNVFNTAALIELPNFCVSDMKTTTTSRVIPSTQRTTVEWINPDSSPVTRLDYGTCVIQMNACDPTSSLNVRIDVEYSVIPIKGAYNFVRGSIPPFGLYTDNFIEFLRVKYPDLPLWPNSEVLKMYNFYCSAGTDSYAKLVTMTHDYTHKIPTSPNLYREERMDSLSDF